MAIDALRNCLRRAGHRHADRAPRRRDHQARAARPRSPSRARSCCTRWGPTTSCSNRCPTTSTPATRRPGSATGVSVNSMRKTRPDAGDRPTTRRSTAGTRCSPTAGFPQWSDGVGGRRGDHRGRRHPGARRRRGAGRDERADHRGRASSGWPGGCSRAARWTGSSRCGCRETRSMMHLDTVMTMVDPETFTKYAGLGMLPTYTVRTGRHPRRSCTVTDHAPDEMHDAIAAALGLAADPRAHRRAGRARGGARAVGRRLQRARGGARGGGHLRAQRDDQHPPARDTGSRCWRSRAGSWAAAAAARGA